MDPGEAVLLLEAARNGDEAAFAAFVAATWKRVYHYARTCFRNEADAEDETQRRFLRLCALLIGEEPIPPNPLGWLLNYVAVHAGDLATSPHVARRVSLPDDGVPDRASGPESAASAKETRAAITAALQQLPEPQRAAFLLHMERSSHAEIAAALDISLNRVNHLLRTARTALQELLRQRGIRLENEPSTGERHA